MMFKTHLAFGFFVALVLLRFLNPRNQLLFAFVLLFGAAFPDIDHPKSKIGRKARPLSYLFEHRGFFHSFFGVVLFTGLLFFLFGSRIYAFAFLAGYLSHILADILSTQGIMPFHPVMKFRLRGILRTGAFYEYFIFFGLVVLDVVFLFGV